MCLACRVSVFNKLTQIWVKSGKLAEINVTSSCERRHDKQHNDTKQNNKNCDTQHNLLVNVIKPNYSPIAMKLMMLNAIMLNVIMLNVIMLNVIMLNVIMLNVI